MTWQAPLSRLLELLFPISRAIAATPNMTAEEAWNSPELHVVREKLMAELTSPGMLARLAESAQDVQVQYASLQNQEQAVSAATQRQLTVLAAGAQALAAESLTSDPKTVFIHALQNIVPWLDSAAQASLFESPLLGSSVRRQATSASAEPQDRHPCGDLVSRDLDVPS